MPITWALLITCDDQHAVRKGFCVRLLVDDQNIQRDSQTPIEIRRRQMRYIEKRHRQAVPSGMVL